MTYKSWSVNIDNMALNHWKHFWDYVDRTGDCWLWQGAKNSQGYGQVRTPYGVKLATHVAWFSVKKVWPKQMNHRCDTPLCVRPRHLYNGTHKENRRDSLRRGRWWKKSGYYQLRLWDREGIAY